MASLPCAVQEDGPYILTMGKRKEACSGMLTNVNRLVGSASNARTGPYSPGNERTPTPAGSSLRQPWPWPQPTCIWTVPRSPQGLFRTGQVSPGSWLVPLPGGSFPNLVHVCAAFAVRQPLGTRRLSPGCEAAPRVSLWESCLVYLFVLTAFPH